MRQAILLEYIYFALLRGERFVRADTCAACLPLARNLSAVDRRAGDVGASCAASFTAGAPRAEKCRLVGDGATPPTDHLP